MIAILTACHGKHEIFKAFLNSIPKDAYLICVGEPEENKKAFEESKVNGTYLIYDNKPLGRKWNYGLKHAANIPFDHLVITGSDDIFCSDLWEWYKTLNVHYAGILDFYFLEHSTGRIKYYNGFSFNRRGETHGAGRAIHRSVLESSKWKLWDDDLDIGLDASMTKTLSKFNLSYEYIKLRQKGFVAVDIKTSENLHRINEYTGRWIDHDEKIWIMKKLGWA